MQKRVQILSLLAVVTFFSGCWKKSEDMAIASSADNDTIKLVNVLDQKYFEDAHIPGSLNISLDDLEKESADWNKDATVVVYCANYNCSASAAAARKFKEYGFNNVKAYEAGMADWAKAGLPVEGPAQEAYLTQENERPVLNENAEQADVVEISTDELANLLGVQKASN